MNEVLTDKGSDWSHLLNEGRWLKQKPAALRLGVDPKTIQRLAEQAKIRSEEIPGMARGRVYSVIDIDDIKANGVTLGGITLYVQDGALSLSRRINAIPAQALVERLDYCWAFLTRYALLRGEAGEKVRANLSYAVIHSRRRHREAYACFRKPHLNKEKPDE